MGRRPGPGSLAHSLPGRRDQRRARRVARPGAIRPLPACPVARLRLLLRRPPARLVPNSCVWPSPPVPPATPTRPVRSLQTLAALHPKLTCPHLAPIQQAGIDAGRIWASSSPTAGRTAADWMVSNGRFSPEIVLEIARPNARRARRVPRRRRLPRRYRCHQYAAHRSRRRRATRAGPARRASARGGLRVCRPAARGLRLPGTRTYRLRHPAPTLPATFTPAVACGGTCSPAGRPSLAATVWPNSAPPKPPPSPTSAH